LSSGREFVVSQAADKVVLARRQRPLGEEYRHAVSRDLHKQAHEIAAQTASRDQIARVIVELACCFPVGSKMSDLERTAPEWCDDLVAEVDTSDGSQAWVEELQMPSSRAARVASEDTT